MEETPVTDEETPTDDEDDDDDHDGGAADRGEDEDTEEEDALPMGARVFSYGPDRVTDVDQLRQIKGKVDSLPKTTVAPPRRASLGGLGGGGGGVPEPPIQRTMEQNQVILRH